MINFETSKYFIPNNSNLVKCKKAILFSIYSVRSYLLILSILLKCFASFQTKNKKIICPVTSQHITLCSLFYCFMTFIWMLWSKRRVSLFYHSTFIFILSRPIYIERLWTFTSNFVSILCLLHIHLNLKFFNSSILDVLL